MAELRAFDDHFSIADRSKCNARTAEQSQSVDPGQAFLMKGLISSKVTIQEQTV